ncbi:MAG: MATE family efflux transporter [bacterium]|nr:MATE family efflux transporter [bacterium]
MADERSQLEKRGPGQGSGGDLRAVLAMAVPLVITTSTRMVMDVSDYVMISFVGSDAQAAMLPAQLTIFTYIVLGFGILSLVNTLAAQSFGRKRYADCSAYAWQGLHLALFFAVVGCGLWPILPWLVQTMGHEPAVQALELGYTRVAVLTIGPTLAGAALSGFFNGVHRPRVTMWSAIEAVVINAVVSYTLIFGLFGLPRMGVEGAAYGTLAGGTYRMIRLLWTMWGVGYQERFETRRTWRFDWSKTRSLLRVGMPTGLQWVSDVVVWWAFVNILVGRFFGTDDLIASNTAWQYLRVAFIPCIGMGIALASLTGKAIGEGDKERAIRLTRIVVLLVSIYMGVFSLLYLLRGSWLISLLSDNPEVIRIGGGVMICAAIFQLFDGLGITYTNALRGAGDTFWPSALFVVSHWVILIGGGWAVAHYRPDWGSIGPWVAASVLLVFTGLALWWRWHSRKWMAIDLLDDDGIPAEAEATPVAAAD